MRHQSGHEKANAHGTRLITAALVLSLGAVSLAAISLLVEHRPAVHSAQAQQDEHPLLAPVAPDSPRKGSGRLARPARVIDVTAPRLRLPWRIERLADGPSGLIVRYPSSAVDRRDGRVDARCRPASGSRFRSGLTAVRCSAADRAGNVARGGFTVVVRTAPGSVPPMLWFPDVARDATREHSAWTLDQ
jgi:HYR domain